MIAKETFSSCWFPPQMGTRARSQELCVVSHVDHRGPSSWSTFHCLPTQWEARSEVKHLGLEPELQNGNANIASGVLTHYAIHWPQKSDLLQGCFQLLQ